jgi:hypothetical protein
MNSQKYVNGIVNTTLIAAGYVVLNAAIIGGQYIVEKISNKISPEEKKELVVKLIKKKRNITTSFNN